MLRQRPVAREFSVGGDRASAKLRCCCETHAGYQRKKAPSPVLDRAAADLRPEAAAAVQSRDGVCLAVWTQRLSSVCTEFVYSGPM